MSDTDVIESFDGDFVSDGTANNDFKDKVPYYPGAGVRIKIKLEGLKKNTGGEAYAKIKFDTNGKHFDAKLALERAVFRVVGKDTLVARDIEVGSGLLLEETLKMDGKRMIHHLKFSDGAFGSWICVP